MILAFFIGIALGVFAMAMLSYNRNRVRTYRKYDGSLCHLIYENDHKLVFMRDKDELIEVYHPDALTKYMYYEGKSVKTFTYVDC